MKAPLFLLPMLAGAPMALAADLDAGRDRVATVCAACHGANGISVAGNIPNLAGQKPAYLTAQLRAFRAGERTNPLMNAIAGQLGDEDVENVSAFLASLPGATTSAARSELLPGVARTRVSFPAGYEATFTRYLKMDFPDRKQVHHFYANPTALGGAAAGSLPDGSTLLVAVFSARLDEHKEPVLGGDGHIAADELLGYGVMATQAGWGADFPGMLRNGDWNYGQFAADGTLREGFNQAVCLACHKPQADNGYLFTMEQLRDSARAK